MTDIKVPKGIKKQDLYDFIDGLHDKKVELLRESYRGHLKLLIDPIYEQVEELAKIGDEIRKLSTDANLNFLYELTGHQYEISQMNYATGMTSNPTHYVKRNLENRMQNIHVLNWESVHFEDNLHLTKFVELWNSWVREFIEMQQPPKKLRRELTSLVKSEKRAVKAFQILAELGLDMTPFQPSEPVLPAIIQTSVDITIFNNIGE